uniref:type IV pilus modification PilV family protein n=1 Tax=Cephaloticoccus sp. TaxID=1985742 RepID=UPI00404A49BA
MHEFSTVIVEASNIVSPHSRRKSTRRAFTLVEVMMAATILLVGFGAMIQAMVIGSEILANARRQTLGSQILTHEIEKLRFNDWTAIDAFLGGPTTITIDAEFTDAAAASGATYALTMSATDVDTNPLLIEVIFTLTWTVRTSGSNAARTFTRINMAYFSKNGLNLSYQ